MKTEQPFSPVPENSVDPLETGGLLAPTPACNAMSVPLNNGAPTCMPLPPDEVEEVHCSYGQSQQQLMQMSMEVMKRSEARVERLKRMHQDEVQAMYRYSQQQQTKIDELTQQVTCLQQTVELQKTQLEAREQQLTTLLAGEELPEPPAKPNGLMQLVDVYKVVEYGLKLSDPNDVKVLANMLTKIGLKSQCQDPKLMELIEELGQHQKALRSPPPIQVTQYNENCQQFMAEVKESIFH